MRWLPILLSLALVLTVVPQPASAARCETLNIEDGFTDLTPEVEEIGDVQVCDEDNDGAIETARLQTRTVPTESELTVNQERKFRPDGQTERTHVELLVSTGIPFSPVVHSDTEVVDDGNDDSIDRANHRGSVSTAGVENHRQSYFIGVWDLDNDGRIDTYGLLVCTIDLGCEAPSPSDLPRIDPDDLPDPVFKLPIVGWVP